MADLIVVILGGCFVFLLIAFAVLTFISDFVTNIRSSIKQVTDDE